MGSEEARRAVGRKEERANRSEGERKEPDIYKWGRKGGRESLVLWVCSEPIGHWLSPFLDDFIL